MTEIIKSIKRAPYQSFASFMILFFTLFLSLTIFNLVMIFHGLLSWAETKPQVIAYFNVNATEKQINKIQQALNNSGKIKSIKYVSQQEALEIYKEFNKDNPLLLEMVSKEILPASLEISATKPLYMDDIFEYLKKQQIIDDVDYQKDIVDRLLQITSTLRKISVLISAYLLLMSIVFIMTTAGFKIALKKEEIDIMQLIGASRSYITKPFLIEGIFFGFISGTVAYLFYYLLFLYFKPGIITYFSSVPTEDFASLIMIGFATLAIQFFPPDLNFIILSYLIVIGSGMLIGFLGNLIATRKYIK